MVTKRIRLHVVVDSKDNREILVEPHAEVLSVKDGDEVEWTSVHNFSIDFKNGSPFETAHFDDRNPRSGVIKVRSDSPEQYYQYKVTIPGVLPMDPGIIIRR